VHTGAWGTESPTSDFQGRLFARWTCFEIVSRIRWIRQTDNITYLYSNRYSKTKQLPGWTIDSRKVNSTREKGEARKERQFERKVSKAPREPPYLQVQCWP
jgi:hypothetical protein